MSLPGGGGETAPGERAQRPRGPARLSPWWPVALGLLAVGLPAALRAAIGPRHAGDLAILLLLAAWGAIVSLDERALGPLVLHEPLVAAGVGGILAGRPAEGLLLGFTLQLVWPGLRPLGGSREPAAGLAALVGLGWYLLLPEPGGPWRFPAALGAAIATASWGRAAEDLLRRRNARREEIWSARGGEAARADRLLAAGAAEALARGLLAIGLLVGVPLAALRASSQILRGHAPGGAFAGAALGVSWSDFMPPEPAVAAVWFLAAGGLVRQAFAARREGGGGLTPALHAPAFRPRRTARGEEGAFPAAQEGGRPESAGSAFRRPARVRAALWIRLLLIQAGFSQAFLQRSGFAALAHQLGRGRREDASLRARALERELAGGRALNTHPATAAALSGALDRLIEAPGREPRPLSRLVEVGGATLAPHADRAFWGAARPCIALAALAIFPFSPAAGLMLFLAAGLVLELGVRALLAGWGRRAGWAVAAGPAGRFSRAAPLAAARLQPALSLAVLGALVASSSPGADPAAWALRGGWFILGGLTGGLARRRGMTWGWLSWGAGAAGTLIARILGLGMG